MALLNTLAFAIWWHGGRGAICNMEEERMQQMMEQVEGVDAFHEALIMQL